MTFLQFKLNYVFRHLTLYFVLIFCFIYFSPLFCSCDFVQIRDSSRRTIASLSGSRNLFTITVRGDRTRILSVTFVSGGSVTGLGFLARYNVTSGKSHFKW